MTMHYTVRGWKTMKMHDGSPFGQPHRTVQARRLCLCDRRWSSRDFLNPWQQAQSELLRHCTPRTTPDSNQSDLLTAHTHSQRHRAVGEAARPFFPQFSAHVYTVLSSAAVLRCPRCVRTRWCPPSVSSFARMTTN